MRDLGALIWLVLVGIGIVSSIVSKARKQTAAAPRVPPRPAPAPQRGAAPPQATPRAPAPAVAFPARLAGSGGRAPAARPFRSRRDLVRAVVAAEVLGKPLALRDEIARY